MAFEYFMIELAMVFGMKFGAKSIHYEIIKNDIFHQALIDKYQASICPPNQKCSIEH